MDNQSLRCLTNSISHFIHLVSSQNVRAIPIQKDYRNMVDSLKLLKPVIDEVIDSKIILDEILRKEIEELDVAVNEARDFMEKWSPRMSRICSVLQSGPLAMKVQCCSLEICHVLCRLLESSTFSSQLAFVQRCMQELRFLEQERISDVIEVSLRDQKDSLKPCASHLTKVVESLGLTSNQDLLMESVALEKERSKSILKQNKEELDLIDQIMYLIGQIRDCMAKLEQFEIINDLLVPPYFRCPLSLGLMLDPVIVASGQTYERAFIQKWLDHGLTACPKTRQTLAHTNLIPNYTVKALITNWCEENNIRFFDNANNGNGGISNFLSHHVSPQDLFCPDTFQGGVHDSNCTSRSSVKALVGSQKERFEVSSKYDEEYSNVAQTKMTSKYNRPSPGQSYIHSWSESTSSAISSIEFLPTSFAAAPTEMSGLSSKRRELNELSGEVSSEFPVSSSSKESGFSPCLSSKQYCSSKARESVVGNAGGNHQKKLSFPFSDSGLDDLTTASHVEALIEDLKSQSNEAQAAAAAELRLLAKHNMENRLIIAECGAIPPLVSLLYSVAKLAQEHAVTALLNLSINDRNKVNIAEAGAIEPLIHVLETGNAGAKENAAATMFSISVLEEYKIKIGRSGAIKALVDLLGSGTLRGKKDAATALFNLSIFHENKARIVQAGAVKYLIELMDPDTGMNDKAVALLANLSTIPEGRLAITREGGIPLLVEVVETGSQRGKENAASILLQLCINNQKFCSLVLQEGAVPPLVALSQSGTPRAKEKAQQLLSHFRNQREGATGKVKS